MKLRVFAIAFFVSAWFGCQCGPTSNDPCEGVRCGTGLTCDPLTGKCATPLGSGLGGGAGGGSASGGGSGQDAGSGCAMTCFGTTPICDPATNSCKTCTETAGCSGATPICQTISNAGLGKCVVCTVGNGCSGSTPACDPTVFPNGACVQCVSPDDCPVPGSVCDLGTNTCMAGNTGGGGGGSGQPTFDDAGMTSRCLPFDAGTMSCTSECPKGYECISNQCQLRGRSGPVQVTLRFNQPQDLDLHLVEPLPDGGTCEIYYAKPGINPNAPPLPFPVPIPNCGAKGWLDVDSNAACEIDNINVENIIYSPGVTPTGGPYIVRVVYYQHCSGPGPIPYEVEVRANGITRWYCGQFQPGDANGGNQGAGRTITTFNLP
ncbi:MAG: hypothetical protein Q8K32_14675 [Archangium sp.]|nr:hypothetical protein [Archangium sp.]